MSSSDSESEWSDVNEEDLEDNIKAQCLFCTTDFDGLSTCFEHIKKEHNVDIQKLIQKLNLDFYGYVKFVNFVRAEKPDPKDVCKFVSANSFDQDQYLQPVIEDDIILQFDVDTLFENNDTVCTSNGIDFEEKLAASEKRAQLAEESLERTILDLERCRKELKKQLLGAAEQSVAHYNETNEGYFTSYAHHGIHEEMIKDKVRTDSYKDFILKNPKIFSGAKVLDVGCGTSILSMFSSQAGAAKVYAVDNSDVAFQAMDIVKENKLDKVITIMKGKAEDMNLTEKVDVIISEWMGYFLLFESMLDTVLFCRDNYLNSSGRIYPDKCNMQLAALADDELYENKVNFWRNVYGFRMSTMLGSSIEEPLMDIVKNDKVISKPAIIQEFDLMKISVKDLDFDSLFHLEIFKDGNVSAIVGYFDIMFCSEENPISFSTSPEATPTHWKQTVFFLKEPLACKSGDNLKGRIFCKKNKKDTRGLDVALIFFKNDSDDVLFRQHYVIA